MYEIKNIQKFRTKDWFSFDGDNTLRLDYDLNENSVVFDVGGYFGLSSQKIWDKFKCNIYIFEPVKEFADKISEVFKGNEKVHVYNFGLSNRNAEIEISVVDDKSSIFKDDSKKTKVKLVKASDFLNENAITAIDLMEINIEGGEYDLLDDLITSSYINKIDNVQVQFHDFVTDADKKMKTSRSKLSESHYPTFAYDFVWDNWKKKEGVSKDELFKSITKDLTELAKTRDENIQMSYKLETLEPIIEDYELQKKEIEKLKIQNEQLGRVVNKYINFLPIKLSKELLKQLRSIKKTFKVK